VRTTLDIDQDVLQAARELSRRERKSLGAVLSELARQALTRPARDHVAAEPGAVYGFRPFGSRGAIVTNELIDTLRDDDAY
jgi:hypothetical protein